jgi:hypothetical protein
LGEGRLQHDTKDDLKTASPEWANRWREVDFKIDLKAENGTHLDL